MLDISATGNMNFQSKTSSETGLRGPRHPPHIAIHLLEGSWWSCSVWPAFWALFFFGGNTISWRSAAEMYCQAGNKQNLNPCDNCPSAPWTFPSNLLCGFTTVNHIKDMTWFDSWCNDTNICHSSSFSDLFPSCRTSEGTKIASYKPLSWVTVLFQQPLAWRGDH